MYNINNVISFIEDTITIENMHERINICQLYDCLSKDDQNKLIFKMLYNLATEEERLNADTLLQLNNNIDLVKRSLFNAIVRDILKNDI